jgi:ATP-dependent Clp protease protease subunit
MEIGQVYINGAIGANDGEVGVNLIDVIKQVQTQPFATSFDVFINSEGGYVDVGFDIYDYLKSLKVPINTIGIGMVASIATVIFMAGDTRKMQSGCKFMIHLPSGEVSGTADEIGSYNEMLKATEDRIIKFYNNTTGMSAEAIKPLLRQETWLNSSDAFDLKFTTEYAIEYSAVAKYEKLNTKIENKMTNEDKSWIEKQFSDFTALFAGKKPKNIMLMDSTGVELEFPTVEDGALPQVGDQALIGGEPAEGTFIMPQIDNATVIIVAGAITEIVSSTEAPTEEEMTALRQENEALKTQLADVTASNEIATAQLGEIETKFTEFKASVTAKFSKEKEERKDEKETVTASYSTGLEKLKTKKRK